MKWLEKIKSVELDFSGDRRRLFRTGGITLLALVVIIVGSARLFGWGNDSHEVMSAAAQRGTFVARVIERGVLTAYRTTTFSAPNMRRGGSAQILEMAEEGSIVQPGDLIVLFDSSTLEQQIEERQLAVERAEASLRRALAQQESQMASLEASYQQQQHSYEQAVLNRSRLEFESVIQQKQEEISFQKSEMALQRAKEAIDQQRAINETSLTRQRTTLQRETSELEELRAELENTELYADTPGLVTYATTFGQNGLTKIKVGDAPYPGQSIIELPDLSRMKVDIGVSELDIHKVAVGQKALVQLDALPEKTFTATVTDVSPLASRVGTSQIKAFDCTVVLDNTDLALRPGMTAQVMIITHYIPDALQVPVEAVFYQAGDPVVFALNGGVETVPVTVGPENGNFVVIEAGLQEGTVVALRDPYIRLEALQTAGMDALKQHRSVSSTSTGGRTADIRVFMMGGGGMGGRGGGGGGSRGGGGDRGRGGGRPPR
jgi:HlyD family secretion protein